MGIFNFLRPKKSEPELDPLRDLVLAKMKVGYLVDYDLVTWTVTAYNRYDWGDGEVIEEWELSEGHLKYYLERSQSDGESFTLSKKIPIGALDGDVRQHIIDHEDPPSQVTFKGTTYYLETSAAGAMLPGGDGPAQELIKWELCDEDDRLFLTIEQWGETEFEAAAGFVVEEYQFEHILPAS